MNRKKSFEKLISESRFYKKAGLRAEEIARNPELLDDLIRKADKIALEKGRGVLGEAWESLTTCFRMLRAYTRGEYRLVPWKTLTAIVGAMVYFVMPLDFMPDYIFGFGYTDDAALVLWVVNSIRSDIDKFSQWEEGITGN